MKAPVVSLTGNDDAAVSMAEAALVRGDLVVIPTETVYGLVADPRVPGSIEQIYKAKKRDRGKPLQLLVSGVDVISRMGFELNQMEHRLADAFWPGGLTLIVESGGRSEGFRVPDSAIAVAIASRIGGALLATSANSSGDAPALTAAEAAACLGESAALILDGGHVRGGVSSTVARVDAEGHIVVLREGAITRDVLRTVGDVHA
ncbi:MAG: L-threonylcarbamoyladenylate synthase [Verrucomicrobia bacterium]|jgi:L-threonylcarbamoyladenylate synthase|nr:L-threonylcarbamoyladenylate synthase [Verrucomicrobiota bacterium]